MLATLVVGPGQTYTTIGAAITAAAAGDTIQVQAGTYTEQLSITKNLAFQGAGSAGTIIQAPAVMTAGLAGAYNVVAVSNAAQVSMTGFSIRGPATPSNQLPLFGVLVLGGATLNLSNSSVSHVRSSNTGAQLVNAIQVGSNGQAQAGRVVLDGVTVSDYQKTGLSVTFPGSTAVVSNSTFTGDGPTSAIAQNGISIQNGAVGTLTYNVVQGHDYTGAPGTFSAGILIGTQSSPAGSGSVLTGNVVRKNDLGVYTLSQGTTTLNGNTLTGNEYGLNASQGTTVSNGDVIQGNGVGLLAEVEAGATGNSVVTVNNSIITTNGIGVQTLDSAGTTGVPLVTIAGGLVNGNIPNFDVQASQPVINNGQTVSNSPPGTGYATGSNQALVAAWYIDFLGRRADPSGLGYFTGLLEAGRSPAQVAGEIYYSQEGRTYRLNILYQTYLNRPVDPSGLSFFTPQMGPGTDERAVVVQLVTSAEYLGQHPLLVPYVESLYPRILGRLADPGGLNFYVGILQQGAPPASVARDLLFSAEWANRQVSVDYEALLYRPADPGGLAFYSGPLATGAYTPCAVALDLATSPEYRGTRAIL